MSRTLEVEAVNASLTLIRGWHARELIIATTGRAPVWATISRGWVVQPSTAQDVVALAERKHYDIVIVGASERKRRLWETLAVAPAIGASTSSYEREVSSSGHSVDVDDSPTRRRRPSTVGQGPRLW